MGKLAPATQAVLDALAEHGTSTVDDLASRVSKSRTSVERAIRQLADAGLIAPGDRGPDENAPERWQAVEANDQSQPDSPDQQDRPDTNGAPTEEQAEIGDSGTAGGVPEEQRMVTDEHPTGGPDSLDLESREFDVVNESASATEQPVAGIRTRTPDRKVLILAGVLGSQPAGATSDTITAISGLNPATVVRLLQAMAQAEAAIYQPEDAEAGTPGLWRMGPGDLAAVDPNPEPPRCPTCGQTIKQARTNQLHAGSGAPGVNNDGSAKFAPGELATAVEGFLGAHAGHIFSPQTITKELESQLGRSISSGAVANACHTLVKTGKARVIGETPFTVTSA
ncbi:hypothetical protein HDA40_001897 [Hamadaea flava]|uniref:Winged helix-turn-helix transcriptional regulator n=1 Tax=Hamadaea flava TaxID=1742688 RepID=A0ABV8LFM5_9ACTN|nr:winged helix-turn-helix transcriptional regulator [Hamadaea flava]MCP2323390.1 hypothetical protein [Hamadaea flava]